MSGAWRWLWRWAALSPLLMSAVVGIVLAKLEASVVFTDLPEVFYLLRRNIAANLDSRQQGRTKVLEHCWWAGSCTALLG
jgi:hypothetical protein